MTRYHCGHGSTASSWLGRTAPLESARASRSGLTARSKEGANQAPDRDDYVVSTSNKQAQLARVVSSNGAAGEGPGRTNLMAVPSTDNLRRLAALLDEGTLQVHLHDTFELDRATAALQTLATEHVRGKLAISVR
jgi:NADPH:quinone reductase-like Zn-dependent oxidoreductase